MWLKLAGSILVVAAGTGIGFSLAGRYNERPRQLCQAVSCLTALAAYIGYASMPLGEALGRAAGGVAGPVGDFFRRTAAALTTRGWLTPAEAMAEVMADVGPALAWQRPEREILLLLGANLGATSREEQQKYLSLVTDQLRRLEQESLSLRDQNVKMFRYLGVCGGLAVAILLV